MVKFFGLRITREITAKQEEHFERANARERVRSINSMASGIEGFFGHHFVDLTGEVPIEGNLSILNSRAKGVLKAYGYNPDNFQGAPVTVTGEGYKIEGGDISALDAALTDLGNNALNANCIYVTPAMVVGYNGFSSRSTSFAGVNFFGLGYATGSPDGTFSQGVLLSGRGLVLKPKDGSKFSVREMIKAYHKDDFSTSDCLFSDI